MLREWPFTARFGAWRSRWANVEPRRLLVQVTQAFIDRAPIDWAILLSRARTDSDRAIVERLRFLDSVREAARRDSSTCYDSTGPAENIRGTRAVQERWSPPSLLVRLAILLATSQLVCSFAVLGVAVANGEAVSNRPSQVTLAFAFTAASLFLAVATSRDSRSLYLLGFFACTGSAFAHAMVAGLPDARAAMVSPLLNGVMPEAFAAACLWQFAAAFPRVRRFTAFDTWARRAAPAAWFLGTSLFSINLFVAHVAIDAGPFAYLLRSDTNRIFSHLLTLAVLPSVATIVARSRRAPLSERRKVARLAFVIAAGTAPLFLFALTRIVWPGIDPWLLTNGFHRISRDLIVAALAATPILTTAAVIVDRPLDLQLILRRVSRYALARSALTTLIVAPFVVLVLTLYGLRDIALADLFAGSRAWLLLSCAGMGCLLLITRQTLLEAIDRRLSRRAADHHELLSRSLNRVRLARGVRETIVTVRRELHEGIGAGKVHVLVAKGTDAFVDPLGGRRVLRRNSAIAAMLQPATTPLDLSPEGTLLSLLPNTDRDWVLANNVALAVALTRRDGRVAAVALVGAKRGGHRFDERDVWFVTTLMTAAAAAWESNRGASLARERGRRANGRLEPALECPRCGVVVDPGPLPCSCRVDAVVASLPRHVRGNFVVQRRLGAGGMGVVYLARDMTLDRDVALKTLPSLSEQSVACLREEARAMAALSHESLAVIYDLQLWRDTPVLVVEYLPNGTLARLLLNGPLPRAFVVQIGLTLTRALAYVHAQGLLHRDLKPSNIGFAATGAPKLLDFGLATLMAPAADLDRQPGAWAVRAGIPSLAGTLAYLPPEAYEGASPTAAFDLWALSIVMLEAMTGVNPFAAANQVRSARGRNSTHGDLSSYLCDLPPILRRFFERALARRPEHRFQTSFEIHSALQAAASSA